MPTITNIAGACQHYHLPYPMTREGVGKLFTAVLLAHPEATVVSSAAGKTCITCSHFDLQCEYSCGRHGWRPEVPPTENSLCKNCPHWQMAETAYILNITNKDTTFDIEASYGNRPENTAPVDTRTEA